MRHAWLLLWVSVACSPRAGDQGRPASPSTIDAPAPPPAPEAPGPVRPTAPGSASPATRCGVSARVESRLEPAERVTRLSVRLENSTGRPVRLEFPSRCPAGFLDFRGVEPGFDFYGTCTRGPCLAPDPVKVITVPAHDEVVVETRGHLRWNGGGCQPKLAPGRYEISLAPPAGMDARCVEPTVVEIAAAARPTTPRKTTTPGSPGPRSPRPGRAAASPGDPRYCDAPADCVVHCPEAKGCCPSAPCGCRRAVNREQVTRADRDYARSCTKPPRCPAVGCALQEAVGATCVNHRCEVMQIGF